MDKDKRLEYIDVCKGVLIIIVILGHLHSRFENYDDRTIIDYYHMGGVYLPFYMSCFFLITGYCSSWDKPIRAQLYDDFRRIVIPGIVIHLLQQYLLYDIYHPNIQNIIKEILIYGGEAWFLSALFLSKIFYRLALYLKKSIRYTIVLSCFLIGAIGFITNQTLIPNIWHVFQACLFLPFLGIGRWMKRIDTNERSIMYGSIFIFIMLFVLFNILDFPELGVCAIRTFSLRYTPLWFLQATAGSIGLFMFIKLFFLDLRFIKFVGKNSLLFYLTENTGGALFFSFVHFLNLEYNDEHELLLCGIFLFCFVMLWCTTCCTILNSRYMKWIMGKY